MKTNPLSKAPKQDNEAKVLHGTTFAGKRLEELEAKYKSMMEKVKRKEGELEGMVRVVNEFQSLVKNLKKWMTAALDRLDEKQGAFSVQVGL